MKLGGVLKLLLILFLLSSIAFSCIDKKKGKFNFKEVGTTEFVEVNPILDGDAPINFKTLYNYILKPKCIGCHSSQLAYPENDPVNLSKYFYLVESRFVPILVKGNAERSRLFLSVKHGEMPPKAPLDPKEIDYIKKWIDLCAPEFQEDINLCKDRIPSEPGDDEPGDDEP